MICAMCRDQEKLGLDPGPRFGGVFELRESNSSADGYWGERWELYKVGARLEQPSFLLDIVRQPTT